MFPHWQVELRLEHQSKPVKVPAEPHCILSFSLTAFFCAHLPDITTVRMRILFYSFIFYFVLLHSFLFCSVPLVYIPFHSVMFYLNKKRSNTLALLFFVSLTIYLLFFFWLEIFWLFSGSSPPIVVERLACF